MTAEDPIPISLVAHTVFCDRRAWLESAGEEVPSVAIEEGVADHAAVDSRLDDRVKARRSVTVSSDNLGIVGRCDVIEEGDDGLRIVEFKSAPLRRKTEVTRAQRIQLALQRLCLEEVGERVVGQSIYFTTSHKSLAVNLAEDDFAEAVDYVRRTRAIVFADNAPPALIDDPRCGRCSHASICLPDERAEKPVRRRVLVPDPGGHVLHVATPGARVSLRAGRIIIVADRQEAKSLPIERVDGLVLHGNVDVSSAVVRELLWTDRPIVWCSARGQVMGHTTPATGPNGATRPRQLLASARGDLALSREFIGSKISNQATQLRRNGRDVDPTVVSRLRTLARAALNAESVSVLFGIEGDAAATYFRWLPTMLSESGRSLASGWPGRIGRGAGDELNVALNLVYGLLLADQIRAVVATGLDPHAGFVHSSSRNKPALALDLMEQFRPTVAESAVLGAINNGELTPIMFTKVLGDVRLRDNGRRALIGAYERRVATEFKHPVFGYRVTWRRAMEIQARMVLGVLDGTQATYVGIRVR